MFGILGTIGVGVAKFAGVHLLPHIPLINKIPGVSYLSALAPAGFAISGADAALSLVGRHLGFLAGILTSFYFTNPAFRAGANECIVAVKNILLGH